MNPYEILRLDNNCDDTSIRKAYLELVKQYPPEQNPEKFKQINSAYSALKDEKSRLQHYLFNKETWIDSPFESLFDHLEPAERRVPPIFEKLKEYLRKCAIQ